MVAEDKQAVVQFWDKHKLDIYINRKVYDQIMKERPDLVCCMEAIAIRCKDVDPPMLMWE